MTGVWAVLPVKALGEAKQRLSAALTPEQRRLLMRTMLEDVLAALAAAPELAGVMLVTEEPWAEAQAARMGARLLAEGARDGHTGAVRAAQRVLAAEGAAGMLALPGDIPGVTAAEIAALAAAGPGFAIAPAHDEMGSNGVLCGPPDAVVLRFGEDSFRPHLAAARAAGYAPRVLALPGFARDIDTPEDIAAFRLSAVARGTRTLALLNS
jgi:2-phospho-L-lactate guanylyltransferase